MRKLVDRIFAIESGVEKHYVEISGDSTETKPTAGIVDGSLFTESDTGKVFFFNEVSGDWVEQFAFQS